MSLQKTFAYKQMIIIDCCLERQRIIQCEIHNHHFVCNRNKFLMQSTQNKNEIIIFAIVDFTFEPYVFGLFQMVFELCNCRSSGSRNH